jgi:photosystem II stability/assembly factor-like uncharacterized protein
MNKLILSFALISLIGTFPIESLAQGELTSYSYQHKKINSDRTELQDKENQLSWLNIYPFNSNIYKIITDPLKPDELIALTSNGLFCSTNDGTYWEKANLNTQNIQIKMFAYHPVTPTVQFILTAQNKLLRSEDDGRTWKDLQGSTIKNVITFAVDPKSPEVAYVSTMGGLFKTLNGGKTWAKLLEVGVREIIINEERSNEIYLIEGPDYASMLLFSDDGGKNFSQIGSDYSSFRSISISGNEKNDLFGLVSRGNDNQFIKSTDKGKTWKLIFEGSDNQFQPGGLLVHAWDQDPTKPNHLFASGTFVESGSGDKWGRKHRIIMESSDAGETWAKWYSPSFSEGSYIKVMPGNKVFLLADGLYLNKNENTKWWRVHRGLPSSTKDILSVDVDLTSNRIFIGATNEFHNGQTMGAIWTRVRVPEIESGIRKVMVDYDNTLFIWGGGNNIIKSTSKEVRYGLIATPEELAKNPRYDKTRTPKTAEKITPSIEPKNIFTVASNSNILYVIGKDDIIVKTEDGGFSWGEIQWKQSVSNEISMIETPNIMFSICKQNYEYLFAALSNRLMRTTDGGNSWIDITGPVTKTLQEKRILKAGPIKNIAIDPDDKNIVYILTQEAGLLKSDDLGKTWKIVKIGSATSPNLPFLYYDIAFYSQPVRTLYIATNNGIYKSHNRGDSWAILNKGLSPSEKITSFATSDSLITAKGENGVYILTDLLSPLSSSYIKTEKFEDSSTPQVFVEEQFSELKDDEELIQLSDGKSVPLRLIMNCNDAAEMNYLKLYAYIDETGKVVNIKIKEKTRYDACDQEFIHSLKSTQLKPILRDGKSVKVKFYLEVLMGKR